MLLAGCTGWILNVNTVELVSKMTRTGCVLNKSIVWANQRRNDRRTGHRYYEYVFESMFIRLRYGAVVHDVKFGQAPHRH